MFSQSPNKDGMFQSVMLEDEWVLKAQCRAMDKEMFFDKYEEDEDLAKAIDENVCLRCPVIKECFNQGTTNEEWGVWGGVYLVDGEISQARNAHKSKDIWQRILEAVNG